MDKIKKAGRRYNLPLLIKSAVDRQTLRQCQIQTSCLSIRIAYSLQQCEPIMLPTPPNNGRSIKEFSRILVHDYDNRPNGLILLPWNSEWSTFWGTLICSRVPSPVPVPLRL